MDKAVKDYGKHPPKDYPGYRPGVFSRDPADPRFSETGVYGDPTLATAEKGKKTLDIMTGELEKALDRFAKEPLVKATDH